MTTANEEDDEEATADQGDVSMASDSTASSLASAAGKTPVSLLQELYVRRGITPKYDLMQIEGAVHEPTFKYRVIVGEFMATGSGQSKKKAKHAAAKAVLEKIRSAQSSLHNSGFSDKIDSAAASSAPSPTANSSSAPALTPVAELAVNFNMDLVLSPQDDGIEGNPIGELQELCMNRRMQPPTYEVCLEEGQPHERRFVIVCTVGSLREEGLGKSKKLAKRQAAFKLLRKMQQQPAGDMECGPGANLTAAVLDEDDLAQGLSARARDRVTGATTGFLRMHRNLRPREGTKLLWLQSQADLRAEAVSVLEAIGKEQDFDVTFVDIEERSTRGQAHCIVQLATSPVAVCYGVGDSDEDAKAEAACNALEYLRVMTKPAKEQQTQDGAVEG